MLDLWLIVGLRPCQPPCACALPIIFVSWTCTDCSIAVMDVDVIAFHVSEGDGFCGTFRIAPLCLILHVLGRGLGHVGPEVHTCLRLVWTFLHLRASLHLGCQRQLPIARFCSSARLTVLM